MRDDIIQDRIKKIQELQKHGYDVYPATVSRTHTIGELLEKFSSLAKKGKSVSIVGRLIAVRNQGGVIFMDLRDQTGTIQLVLKKNSLDDFDLFQNTTDIGDFAEAQGTLFKTQKGQQSIDVHAFRIITKSIRPLPSEWFGLEDIETKLRKRYLDLISHPELRELFIKKSIFWDSFRTILKKNNFLEVENPALEPIPGGADAEPFITHHNALDTDFFLRISLELPLKKILVAGFEKVFEMGRVFRNEGIDREHLQDYTALEFYWAYADYEDLMKFVEKMYKEVIKKTTGGLITTWEKHKINWGKAWAKIDYYKIFEKMVRLDLSKATQGDLYQKALTQGLQPTMDLGRGKLIDLLFKKIVRPTLIQPAFLINPPVDIEPLAKRLKSDPNRVARMQVVACGSELGKGFSELNDPQDQRGRFEEQMRLRAEGDKEAQMLDEDFLEALEYGMPPTAGFGVSERLFAILMNRPVRETVIFPLMRPKK